MDATNPTISLVIPSYNRGHLIAETLDTALAQDPPFLEVIVVDDGSTDDTAAVMAQYAGKVQFLTGPNGGVQRARNRGVDAARGTYITLCDSDDLLEPGFVGAMQTWLRDHPDCNSIYSNFVNFDEQGVYPDKFSRAPATFFQGIVRKGDFWYGISDLYARILSYQPLFPSGSIVRRALYKELGGYDTQFNRVGAEDFEFALRIAESGNTALCALPLVRIRRHNANDSLDNVRQVRGEIQILEHALVAHRSGSVYREAIIDSIEARRLDVFNGAFARGEFDVARRMLAKLLHPPRDIRFKLKAVITRLPQLLRKPLWRATQ